jgi:type I restriction enzyme S subunit
MNFSLDWHTREKCPMTHIKGWHPKSLRQLATINYGRSPAGILADDGEYPVVGTGGTDRLGNDYLYEGDSVILGRKGTIDRVHFATGRFWTIDTAYYLTDFRDSLPRWLFYFLQTVDLRGMNEATGVPSLSRELLYKIQVPTPPKREQTKIVEVLSAIDLAIDQTEALIGKQRRIKTGLLQDLISFGIDECGNLRAEATHEFKDSHLGRIPAEWDVVNLGSMADFVTSGSRGWARYYAIEGAIFLRIGNLTRNDINLRLEDIVRVNPTSSLEGRRTAVLPGDLLVSITADLGIVGVIPKRFPEAYVNQHIALVRLDHTKANARFFGWFLSSRSGQSQFEKLNESGAKAGLNLPTVRKLLVPSMGLPEQAKIASVLDATTRQISDLKLRLDKLCSLKAGLTQDLLSGRRRVTAILARENQQTALAQ